MLDISALVLTHNEADNIARCLGSLRFCREIVIVDSGSSDDTLKIASRFTDKIFQHPLDGFGPQRNWGIERAEFDWILWIDADEEISPELRSAIQNLSPSAPFVGYYINRKNRYLGRWIKHSGWSPQFVLRLFNRKFGHCRNVEVHESIEIKGDTAVLPGEILHYPYRNVSHHLAKIDYYTTLAARENFHQGHRFNLFKAVFDPFCELVKKLVFKFGFLDGIPGFCLAVTSAYYRFQKQIKLYEMGLKKDQPENTV